MKKFIALGALACVLAFGSTESSAQDLNLLGLGNASAGVVVGTIFVGGVLLYVVANGDGTTTTTTTLN